MPDLSPEQLRERLEPLLLAEDAWGHTRTGLSELGPAATPVLVDLIQERTHDTKFTERAILALGEVGGSAQASFVVSLLEDPDPMVTLAALTAMRRIGGPEHSAAVQDLLEHESASVRNEAVKTLAELGGETILQRLRSVAANDPEQYVRTRAAQAVDQVEKRAGREEPA